MKEWSRLKRAIVISVVGFFGLVGLGSLNSSQQNKTNVTPSPSPSPTQVQGAETETKPQATPVPTPAASATTPTPVPTPAPQPKNSCDPNYSGCVPIASDVDCAGGGGNGPAYVSGPVYVTGSDIYGLDRDHDGIACE